MSSGYVRQAASNISTGLIINASDFNAEYNQIQAAFDGTTGHDHTGGIGLGPKIGLTNAVTGILPSANGGTGIAFITFAGPTVLRTYTLPDSNATILTNASTLGVANGGTGLTAGTSGGLLYFSGAGTIASSTALGANQILLGAGAGLPPASLSLGTSTTVLHGNAGGAPTWGAVGLTTDITGTLPITNGGTGQTTANAAFNAFAPSQATNSGKYLTTDGTNTSWGTIAAGFTDPGSNGVVVRTALNTTTARTITGTAGTITVTNGDGTAGNPTLTISASYIGQSTITTLGTISTGVWSGTAVSVAKGGTGATSANAGFNALSPMTTSGDVIYGGAAGVGTRLAANATATNKYLQSVSSGIPAWAQVADADLSLTDVTTNNVSSTTHGFVPKSPADATQFLNGATTPVYAQVKDSDLSTSDITTNNVSTTKHGFAPKAPNDATKYLDGTGAYSVPAALMTPLGVGSLIWAGKNSGAATVAGDTVAGSGLTAFFYNINGISASGDTLSGTWKALFSTGGLANTNNVVLYQRIS